MTKDILALARRVVSAPTLSALGFVDVRRLAQAVIDLTVERDEARAALHEKESENPQRESLGSFMLGRD